jgi:hypothetical protein
MEIAGEGTQVWGKRLSKLMWNILESNEQLRM